MISEEFLIGLIYGAVFSFVGASVGLLMERLIIDSALARIKGKAK